VNAVSLDLKELKDRPDSEASPENPDCPELQEKMELLGNADPKATEENAVKQVSEDLQEHRVTLDLLGQLASNNLERQFRDLLALRAILANPVCPVRPVSEVNAANVATLANAGYAARKVTADRLVCPVMTVLEAPLDPKVFKVFPVRKETRATRVYPVDKDLLDLSASRVWTVCPDLREIPDLVVM